MPLLQGLQPLPGVEQKMLIFLKGLPFYDSVIGEGKKSGG